MLNALASLEVSPLDWQKLAVPGIYCSNIVKSGRTERWRLLCGSYVKAPYPHSILLTLAASFLVSSG